MTGETSPDASPEEALGRERLHGWRIGVDTEPLQGSTGRASPRPRRTSRSKKPIPGKLHEPTGTSGPGCARTTPRPYSFLDFKTTASSGTIASDLQTTSTPGLRSTTPRASRSDRASSPQDTLDHPQDEAAAAAAFFSNMDRTSIQGLNQCDIATHLAELNQALASVPAISPSVVPRDPRWCSGRSDDGGLCVESLLEYITRRDPRRGS